MASGRNTSSICSRVIPEGAQTHQAIGRDCADTGRFKIKRNSIRARFYRSWISTLGLNNESRKVKNVSSVTDLKVIFNGLELRVAVIGGFEITDY